VTRSPELSRRSFLALAGSGAALAALARLPAAAARAAAAPAAAASAAPAAAAPFFAPAEAEILTAVVERMVDSGLEGAPRVRETRAVETIDRLCLSLDPALTRPLPALLRVVEWGPYLFDWTFARFSALGAEAQDASLRGWMSSGLALRRQGFQALKNLSFLGWYSQEESWRAIGYAGPLLARRSAAP
jgi:hypothetical protein